MTDVHPIMKKLHVLVDRLYNLNLPAHMAGLFPNSALEDKALPESAAAVLAFAEDVAALNRAIGAVMPNISRETVLWFAYPKKTSKRYRSDITRDTGWGALAAYDYEPVSQVALDEDWSVLRFKPFAEIRDPKRAGRMVKPEE